MCHQPSIKKSQKKRGFYDKSPASSSRLGLKPELLFHLTASKQQTINSLNPAFFPFSTKSQIRNIDLGD
jgi:hypothetical protein